MRISDWSSDVCSSDLRPSEKTLWIFLSSSTSPVDSVFENSVAGLRPSGPSASFPSGPALMSMRPPRSASMVSRRRSEERRVGKSVSVRVDLGGRRILQKKQKTKMSHQVYNHET